MEPPAVCEFVLGHKMVEGSIAKMQCACDTNLRGTAAAPKVYDSHFGFTYEINEYEGSDARSLDALPFCTTLSSFVDDNSSAAASFSVGVAAATSIVPYYACKFTQAVGGGVAKSCKAAKAGGPLMTETWQKHKDTAELACGMMEEGVAAAENVCQKLGKVYQELGADKWLGPA